MRITFIVIFLLAPHSVIADCDFKTGEYIEQLSSPKSISSIEIRTSDVGSYIKNGYKIILSEDFRTAGNIQPKLRRGFKSTIKVNYPFGSCKYLGRVRQSGDLYDHIKLIDDGWVLRSLDVKLREGNVIGAVGFKLLLPSTRNYRNEILGTLLLKKLNFISPETFEVSATINGLTTTMLFQEKAAKELLEKNLRREGPIFEADEELIWSYSGYDILELDRLALTRLENENWFEKGRVAQRITMHAHSRLQESYLNYGFGRDSSSFRFAIFPDREKVTNSVNFHLLMLAMNGLHGLAANNRKFYYNVFESSFEPVYYDGDLNFQDEFVWSEVFKRLFPLVPPDAFNTTLNEVVTVDALVRDFHDRVGMSEVEARKFVTDSLDVFMQNVDSLTGILNAEGPWPSPILKRAELLDAYKLAQKDKEISQLIIDGIRSDGDKYVAQVSDGSAVVMSPTEVGDLMSRNAFEDRRAVFLAPPQQFEFESEQEIFLEATKSLIRTSRDMVSDINIAQKVLNFRQSKSTDWALISGGHLDGWTISFEGIKELASGVGDSPEEARVRGLTGCLTLYGLTLQATTFIVNGGACEDSVNFVRTLGDVGKISVADAFSDAVDLDFSKLRISQVFVERAANDCVDLSAGEYEVGYLNVVECGDKGVSVGEASTVSIDTAMVARSPTAIVSKDFSVLRVKNLDAVRVDLCADAYKKKQEFGGANIYVLKSACETPVTTDTHSSVLMGSK